MKTLFTGALLAVSFALATPAWAASGQCSLTGYETFDCDVETDGAGLTFALPDGQIFAFALTDEAKGSGYRIPQEGSSSTVRPVELGVFVPVPAEAGCWQVEQKEIKFCALVYQ